MKRFRRGLVAVASGVLLAGTGVFAGTSAVSAAGPSLLPPGATVEARLLNNPRQLSLVGESNTLLIAEAGTGGKTCINDPELGTECIGNTGAIRSLLLDGHSKPVRIVSGLPSAAGPDGSFAVGSDGVSARHLNQVYIQETFFPPEAVQNMSTRGWNGKTLRLDSGHGPFVFADISGFEAKNDPDHQGFDSDPYSVLQLSNRVLVADAAGNDILSVAPTGKVSLLAVLPNVQDGPCAGRPNDNGTTGCDAVPTSLAVGPNGDLYVGQLAGEAAGAARITEINLTTGATVKTYTGLTTVTGVAVGADGSIYASELEGGTGAVPGQVTKIAPNGTRTSVPVPFPAGLALDSQGRLYVSAFSTSPQGGLGVPGIDTSGQVWRMRI
jgi:hypothetical protein